MKTMVYHLSVYLTARKKKKKSQRNLKERLSPFPTQPEGRDDFKKTGFGIVIGLSQSLLCNSKLMRC